MPIDYHFHVISEKIGGHFLYITMIFISKVRLMIFSIYQEDNLFSKWKKKELLSKQ